MAVTNKQGAGSQAAGQGANQQDEQASSKKRRHTGAAKRAAQRKLGRRVAAQRIDLSTAAESAKAQYENGRAASAGGRKSRVEPEVNIAAFPLVRAAWASHEAACSARGTTKMVVKGAELNLDRLSVIVEVASLSATTPRNEQLLAAAARVGKCRDAIYRVLPGPQNAEGRAAFGFGEQVRADDPPTVLRGAQKLLAGKRSMPESRAARLLTADDEKQLKAIVKSIQSTNAQRTQSRKEGSTRSTEKEILNAALELFYDDFAASIGLALQDDDVARIQALELIPRRAERREAGGAPPASSAAPASGAAAPAASARPAAVTA